MGNSLEMGFDELLYDEKSKCIHLLKGGMFVMTINTKKKTVFIDNDFLE